jgi:nucleotide-binding universal stress UspA family protein
LAAVDKSALVFCSVVQIKDVLEGATAYACDSAPMIEELQAMASSYLVGPMARAHELMLSGTSLVAEGDAADQLLLNAKAQGAGLIVMGTHGRRGLQRLVIGSVAESVVHRSMVPVVVLRSRVPRAAE